MTLTNTFAVRWRYDFESHPSDIQETYVPIWSRDDGEHVAEEIAQTCNSDEPEDFRSDTTIVIIEPKDIAGEYLISVDYSPTFNAYKS